MHAFSLPQIPSLRGSSKRLRDLAKKQKSRARHQARLFCFLASLVALLLKPELAQPGLERIRKLGLDVVNEGAQGFGGVGCYLRQGNSSGG
jgi:Mor family transcriptional regulator